MGNGKVTASGKDMSCLRDSADLQNVGDGNGATVLFPGSFDPFTCGHADIVERALRIFGSVVVAVGYNEHKPGWMPVEQRVRALEALYRDEPRVSVTSYSCLTTDFALQQGIGCILRGIRSVKDYEYELQIADVNKKLTGIETVLMFSSPELSSISSSVVRELAHFGKDISFALPDKYVISI